MLELPAIHEGGALELSHEGETLRFSHSGMNGAMSVHWAAFYAASGHQLTPVTSGRRLSLCYSLSRADEGPPLLPPSQAAVSRRFERLEKRWVADEEGDAPQKLVYFLEKQEAELLWDGLQGDDRSIVEALLGAKHGGESAYDLFLATFTVREFKRAAGGWQEESSEAVDWEVHPDLDVPEVVVEAAEALGWPEDGEIVQGDDFFDLLHEPAHEGSEDSEDESEEEDEDDYYHRGRYGYGGYDDYDDRERHEKANKQRREKQRHALVLWPRRTRARVLSLEGVIGCAAACPCTDASSRPRTPRPPLADFAPLPPRSSDGGRLLETALDGDTGALAGYADIEALQAACMQRTDGWTAPLLLRMLAATLVPPIGVDARVDVIQKLRIKKLKIDDAAPLLVRAAQLETGRDRVLQAIIGLLSAHGNAKTWKLLERLSSAPELGESCREVATKLTTKLTKAAFKPFPPNMQNYEFESKLKVHCADIERAASAVLEAALHALVRMGLSDELCTAARNVAQNTSRFDPVAVLVPCISRLRATLQAEGGVDITQCLKTLSDAVPAALLVPSPTYGAQRPAQLPAPINPMGVEEMVAVFSMLIDAGNVSSALMAIDQGATATLAGRFPLTNLCAAVNKLLADEGRRAAVLGEGAWPRMLLKLFPFLAPQPTPAYAYQRPQAQPLRQDVLVALYPLLATFDAAVPAAAPISPSYRSQLVAAAGWWNALKELTPAVLALKPKLDIAGRKHPAFAALLQLALVAMRRAVAPLPAPMKDWSISGAIVGCSCTQGCSEARRILENPMAENGTIAGVHAIANSHLARQLTAAAAKPNSGFKFQQVSSKATRVNGRLMIVKNAAGRTPVAQLRNAQAAKAQRDAQLVPLRQLEEIADEISAPSKDQPVVECSAYVALLAALRTGATAADGAAKKQAEAAASPAALAAAALDPTGAALQAATAAATAAAGEDEDEELAVGSAALVTWVGAHLPPEQREVAEAAVVNEELADLEVLRSMPHAELAKELLGRAVPPSEAPLFLGVRQLWLSLRRRETAATLRRVPAAAPVVAVSASQVAGWLRQRLGYHPALSCAELRLDGDALCSLSAEEWLGLAPRLAPNHAQGELAELYAKHLAPAAALAAASPARHVEVLPELAVGAPFSVIVAGDTGTGKSTLLNALLGVELLPTSCCRACTAAVVELEWAADGGYSAGVQLVAADEWRATVEAACAAAARAGVGKAPPETDAGYVAYARAASVYGRGVALQGPIDLLMAHPSVAEQLGQSLELRAESAAELGQRTRPYMDSADEAHDGALWPLVRRVFLRGPFAVCAPSALCVGGIRLLDAPGLHDDNAARDGVLRGVVAEAHSVLVVSNIRRACNDKGAKDMMPLPLRRALLSSGFAGALTLVARPASLCYPGCNSSGCNPMLPRRARLRRDTDRPAHAIRAHREPPAAGRRDGAHVRPGAQRLHQGQRVQGLLRGHATRAPAVQPAAAGGVARTRLRAARLHRVSARLPGLFGHAFRRRRCARVPGGDGDRGPRAARVPAARRRRARTARGRGRRAPAGGRSAAQVP